MRDLIWTKDPPKVEGWYWLRWSKAIVVMAEVRLRLGVFTFWDTDDINSDGVREWAPVGQHNYCEWAGPIPEPKEVPDA